MSLTVVNAPHGRVTERVDSSEIVYKMAEDRQEREGAFRLVYDAYRRSGLLGPNAYGMRVTPHHLLPTTEVFIGVRGREIVCTATLIMDGALGLPMEAIYEQEVASLRAQGISLAEVSGLADRRQNLSRSCAMLIHLTRLVAQYARYNGVEQCLIAVHPRHARFYERCLCYERLGGVKAYPMVRDNPAVAMRFDFACLDRARPEYYDQFFGETIPEQALRPRPMSLAERLYFAPVTQLSGAYSGFRRIPA